MTLGVAIIGVTGSVGMSALSVIENNPDLFHLESIVANSNVTKLVQIARRIRPKRAVIGKASLAKTLCDALFDLPDVSVEFGSDAINEVAKDSSVDIVIAAIVGSAGLYSTYAAVEAGKRVLIANKESLVMAGKILIETSFRTGATILPIDSEHNAILQCLPHCYRTGEQISDLSRIILTCSGGPFRKLSEKNLQYVTPEQACTHPIWSMGPKISVDSATLMNKGLELIEACHLFRVEQSFIDIIVHPQGLVHSMIEFSDGSVMAQLGFPDMRIPISVALRWPRRTNIQMPRMCFSELSTLEFEPPRNEAFPALNLARNAFSEGGDRSIVLNAANEVAVSAFLGGKISFLDISCLTDACLNKLSKESVKTLDDVFIADHRARDFALKILETMKC